MRTLLVILLLVMASLPGTATAAAVTISPSGNGVYLLAGQALQNVSGLDITVTYDTAALSDPRVTSGGLLNGALLMTNTSTSGMIRVAAVHQGVVQGSGPLATISFAALDQAGGGQAISGLKVTAISPQGVKSPMPAVIAASAGTGSEGGTAEATAQTAQQTSAASAAVTASPVAPPAGLVIASPPTGPSKQNDEPPPATPDREQLRDPDASARTEQKAPKGTDGGEKAEAVEQRHVQAEASVRERFREFRGPWTVRDARRLFQQNDLLGCSQEPRVALADGRGTVTLTVVTAGKAMPSFTLSGGSIQSAVRDRERTNTWVLRARPNKDALDAILRIDDGTVVREIPLTVTPRSNVDLDGSGTVTEKDFALYGRQRRVKGERERNYLADFVFVANYLIATGGQEEKARSSRPAVSDRDASLITRK